MMYFFLGLAIAFLSCLILFLQSRQLEAQILIVLLRYGEMYGLQITETIERNFDDPAPGFGILYPALRRLERQGLVTSRWGEEQLEVIGGARRRYYRRTGKRSRWENKVLKSESILFYPSLAK